MNQIDDKSNFIESLILIAAQEREQFEHKKVPKEALFNGQQMFLGFLSIKSYLMWAAGRQVSTSYIRMSKVDSYFCGSLYSLKDVRDTLDSFATVFFKSSKLLYFRESWK